MIRKATGHGVRNIITGVLVFCVCAAAPAFLAGCGSGGEGKVIIQEGGRTLIFDSQAEYQKYLDEIGATSGQGSGRQAAGDDDDDDDDDGGITWTNGGSGGGVTWTNGGNNGGTLPGSGGNAYTQEAALNITPTEASQVRFVSYSDPGGYFTGEFPAGWSISTGLKPTGELDLISYAITLYDPKNPDRQLYFNLNCAAGVKSQAAHEWYVNNYGASSFFAQLPVITEKSTAGYFSNIGGLYGYKNFSVLENLGRGVSGGDILVANCVSSSTGKTLEGIFTAWVTDGFSYEVMRNMFDYSAGTIDAGPLTAYTIVMETAPAEEFLDWQPILDHCLASIRFTSAFTSARQEAWRQIMGTSSYLMQTADSVSDMIMDSYEYRNRTYDVSSQKYSDATLGYERVLDTQTGDYYKAENGFSDWYDGSRYQPVSDDTAYLSPVEGYINWK